MPDYFHVCSTEVLSKLCKFFNPFPHNNIFNKTKMKAFAADKLNVTTRGPWWSWIAHLSHFHNKFSPSLFQLVTPRVEPVLTPGASYEKKKKKKKKIIKVHYKMLLAIYQSSRPSSFRDEVF